MATTTKESYVYNGGKCPHILSNGSNNNRDLRLHQRKMSTYSLKWLQQLMRFTYMLGINVTYSFERFQQQSRFTFTSEENVDILP